MLALCVPQASTRKSPPVVCWLGLLRLAFSGSMLACIGCDGAAAAGFLYVMSPADRGLVSSR